MILGDDLPDWLRPMPAESAPITGDSLREAFRRVQERERNTPPHGTPGNPHVVHPADKARGKWAICECGPVWCGDPNNVEWPDGIG